MEKVLIIYYSRSGHTQKMAEIIAEAIKKEQIEVEIKKTEEVNTDDLLNYDGIIAGSPTYYGGMAAELKKIFDNSIKFHGKLDGKVGAAFASSGGIGGGNETTILSIIKAMLIHGMIVQGDPNSSHYGVVAIEQPDERVQEECTRMGIRIAQLIKKIKK